LELTVPWQHEGDSQREGAALARLALQVNVAAEQLGQLADDRESQSGPLVLPGQDILSLAGSLGLAELLEDGLAIFFGDADAGIFALDTHKPALGPGAERHSTPLRGELDGVG